MNRTAAIVGTIALLLGLAPPALAEPRAPLPPAEPQRLVYTRTLPDGERQLRLVRADGSEDRLLADGGLVGARWSPRGDAVVATSLPDDGAPALVSVPGGDVRLLDVRAAGLAVVSPDGTRAIVVRDEGEGTGGGGLVLVDLATRTLRALPGTEEATSPVWGPTGEEVAYLGAGGGGVFVAGLDGRAPRRLTPPELSVTTQVDWSPDGRRIAFAGRLRDSEDEDVLWLVSPEGTGLTGHVVLGEAYPAGPVWSPDGGELAVSARQGDGGFDVQLVTPFPGGVRGRTGGELIGPGDLALPSWSADGRQLALTRFASALSDDPQAEVVVVDADDFEATTVASDGQSLGGAFAPGLSLRLGGSSRITTATTLSRSTFASAGTVVLARADDYADALAGAPLAARDGAPILLTGSDRLAAEVEEELVRLGARTVILLGGTAALSPAVAADTAAVEGVARVERVSGANRFATAAALAETVTAVAAETSTAYLVEGLDPDPTRGWPDAVSVAGLAAFEGRPVLLTATEALPPATAEALEEGGYERVVVVGGEGAVSRSVVKEVERLGLAVERVAGGDRYATAVAIARRGLAAGMRAGRTLLATGASFSDALAAGPVAAAVGGPVVLADPLGLERTPDLARYLDDVSGGVERVRLVGGPAVLPPPFRVELERALTPLP